MKITRWIIGAAAVATFAFTPMASAKEGPPDAWLTLKAKIAVLREVGTSGTGIHVDTVNGRVTLHGQVSDATEKEAAEKVVRQVDGVREVQNLLQVVAEKDEKKVDAADEQIQKNVEKTLRDDSALKGSDVTVQSVNKGTVLLAGKTESLSDHLRALEDARSVKGVRKVGSEIESPDAKGDEQVWSKYAESTKESEQSTSKSIKETAGDMYITSAAKMRLLTDSKTPGMDINVDTDRGVVTLFGAVPNEEAKRKAEAEARKVSGVKRVKNELQVVPSGVKGEVSKRDSEIEDAVEKAVAGDQKLKDADIDVEVSDGVARLSGTVPSESLKAEAESRAKKVDGVRKVEDDLKVKSN